MMFTQVLANAVVNNEMGLGTVGNWCGMSVSGANNPFITGASPGVWNDVYGNYGRNLSDIVNICSTKARFSCFFILRIGIEKFELKENSEDDI